MSRSLDQEATQWSKPKRTNGRSLERLPRELATATLVVMIVGFVLGSAGTYGIQWRFAGDAPWKAFLKAVLAGVVVGLPWPVGGTLFGGWVLLFSGLGNAKKELRDR